MSFTAEQIAKAQEARTKRHAALAESRENLTNGAEVVRDHPPGTGWRLSHPKGPDRFYARKEDAIHWWLTTG